MSEIGTLLSPVNNLTTVNAGPTPLGIQNNQWNWLLLTIANPISSITGQRYVGDRPAAGSGEQPHHGQRRPHAAGDPEQPVELALAHNRQSHQLYHRSALCRRSAGCWLR